MARHELPLPPFFNPSNSAQWAYQPNHQALIDAAGGWRKQHGIKPSGSDKQRIHLLGIDWNKDFCFPGAPLYVGGRSGDGAVKDTARFASFVYRNLDIITDYTNTMDTHFAFQIFFSTFWVNTDGQHPPAMVTQIPVEDVESGKWQPNPVMAWWLCNGDYVWLSQQVLHYCKELKKAGKYTLTIWNPHCILGSDGHALVGVIHEAQMFLSFVRGSQSNIEVKGGHPLTENYSVLRPEVLTRFDGAALVQKNVKFIKKLLTSDMVIIGGEADSHCVASTIDDLLNEILALDPKLAKKVYILEDCMSSVVVPGIVDFTPQAEAAHDRFRNAGMHLVNSTDPIESWPNVRLAA